MTISVFGFSSRMSLASKASKATLPKPEAIEMDDGASTLSVIWTILKKAGTDPSARMSLPAQLMLPQSNLDYWGYMDRPDLFVSMADSADPTERMLHVLRWFLCKDTKFKGEHAILKKAFTPVLGEFFRCKMTVPDARQPLFLHSEERAGRASTESHASFSSHAATLCPDIDEASGEDLTVHCVSEQITHSPSIAAFYYESQARGGIMARGVDHVQAKFTGTAVKIGPGDYNHGVYVHLAKHNEEYNCTHPWASVSGWLSGHPYITV
ncbi:hypothetical protein BC830DRAFT_236409, partial [Chytriomyces sp. MP71]